MADGHIVIETKMDDAGLDKGLNNVDKKLQKGTKSSADFSASLAKVGVAAGASVVALKKVVSTIKDLAEGYNTQIEAEKRLEFAARNNPLLNNEAVSSLKNYADELANTMAGFNEEIIGLMGELAATGRSQEEIQKIMKTSMDIAASGAMSLESAVDSLNKTFSGMPGLMARSIPELKDLTQEELRNGAAVDVLAGKYAGMAEELAKATGSRKELSSALGDFKEELGAPFEKAMIPMRRFFTELFGNWSVNMKKAREAKEEVENMFEAGSEGYAEMFVQSWEKVYGENAKKAAMSTYADVWVTLVREAERGTEDFNKALESIEDILGISSSGIIALALEYNILDENITGMLRKIGEEKEEAYKAEQERLRQAEEAEAEKAKREAEEKKRQNEIKEIAEERAKYLENFYNTQKNSLEAQRIQAELEGKQVDDYEKLNLLMGSYVNLIIDSGGLVQEADAEAQELLATIKQMAEEQEAILKIQQDADDTAKKISEKETERLRTIEQIRAEMQSELDTITIEEPVSKRLEMQLNALDKLFSEAVKNEALTYEMEKEYAEKRILLQKQIADAKIAEQKRAVVQVFSIAKDFAAQYADVMNSIQSLAIKRIENETIIKMDATEKMYERGELSAEEYEEKMTEINKKAAQEKYKADLWAWKSNLMLAAANNALAFIKALAEGGPIAGPILAGLIAIAGSFQIANLIESKPLPPAFATGGIVSGNSYYGDKKIARVNSGEMIFNYGQQKNLFDRIDRGDLGDTKINIINKASNDVKAEPKITRHGIELMISRKVAKDMAEGKYNKAYKQMRGNLGGVRLTN